MQKSGEAICADNATSPRGLSLAMRFGSGGGSKGGKGGGGRRKWKGCQVEEEGWELLATKQIKDTTMWVNNLVAARKKE